MMGDRWARALVLTLVSLSSIVAAAPAAQAVSICPEVTAEEPPPGEWVAVGDLTGVPGSDETLSVGSTGVQTTEPSSLTETPFLRRWNGTEWSTEDPTVTGFPDAYFEAVDAVTTDNIWIAGIGYDDSSATTALVMEWDGTVWTTHIPGAPSDADPDSGIDILAIDAVSATDVWIAGLYLEAVGGTRKGFASHFDGSDWTVREDIPASRTLRGIHAVAGDDVWIVGDTNDGSLALHWNGSDWTQLGSSDVEGQEREAFYAVLDVGAEVWVAGSYRESEDVTRMLARRWDGTTWTNYPMPNLGDFQILDHLTVTPGGELWAYGYEFSPVHSLVRFDGERWVRYEDGMDEFAHSGGSITASEGHLWLTQSWGVVNTRPLCVRATTGAVVGADDGEPGDIELKTKNAAPDPATDGDNVMTWLDLPAGVSADVSVRETFVEPPSVQLDMDITGSVAATDPIRLDFQVDGSLYQDGRTGSIVRKDGAIVPACTTDGQASPDPCVDSDTTLGNDDHEIIVNTTSGGLWTFSQTRPTASIASPTTLTGPVTVTFDADVRRVTRWNLPLLADGQTVNAMVECKNGDGGPSSCWDGPVRSVTVSPRDRLIPGQKYVMKVNPSGFAPLTDTNNVPATSSFRTFRGQLTHEDTSSAITYNWQRIDRSGAYGGSYRRSRLSKNKATYEFDGTQVTLYGVKGPNMGKAEVRIDGALKCTCDFYAPTTTYRSGRTFGSLSDEEHTMTITPTGTKRASSTGTYVAVDAVQVLGNDLEATPVMRYTWQPVGTSLASGDRLVRYDLSGGSFQFTFRGTAIDWYALRGPSQGKARIKIDGVTVETWDAYRSSSLLVRKRISGFTNAVHTLKVEVLGTRNSASSNSYVSMDRLVVP